jgi:hypothetical protein
MLETEILPITVIFLALILSLCVLAWRHPTSLSSLRAGTALPAPNIAPSARSLATHGRSFAYPRGTWFLFYGWWRHASHNGINRVAPSQHHEQSVARARSPTRAPSAGVGTVSSTRAPTPATFAFTFLGGSSSINTAVDDSDAMELHKLDGTKGPSTSSMSITDCADMTNVQTAVLTVVEPIVRVEAGTVSEASQPCLTIDCLAVEADVIDIDKVAIGRQSLR